MSIFGYYGRVERGVLDGGLRYCRFGPVGAGDQTVETIVVIPGIDDALHDFGWFPRMWAWYFRPLAVAGYSVVLLCRPKGLSDHVGTAELADVYASVIEQRFGPCHVVGISMGGMIAQHLAVRHPSLVRRLVLAVTAHKVSPAGREYGQELIDLAMAGRWRRFFLRFTAIAFTGLHRWALTFGLWVFGFTLVARRRRAATDFSASANACTAHDGSQLLGMIQVPTLVWGAHGDCIFPYDALVQMASALPRAELVAVPGAHAAFIQRRSSFHGSIRKFLSAPAEVEAS